MIDGDRRAAGVKRIPLQTTVEMCGLDPQRVPAFEAESLDVSGRGLHLRTAYVPEVGGKLVCRFEDRGRQIIAEGVVAWVEADEKGGDFGLKFTALDSGSVNALRELTGLQHAESEQDEDTVPDPAVAHESASPPQSEAAPAPALPRNEPGARVKLHIEGLGAPMKALVRQGSRSRVKVGSKLEFLRVGRRLEIENLELGARRTAHIDMVDVVLDPQSGVPQLMVALRYDDIEDVTPEPAVLEVASDASPESDRPSDNPLERGSSAASAADTAADDYEDEDEDEDEDETESPEDAIAREASAFQGKFTLALAQAGRLAQKTGATFARLGGAAAARVAGLAHDARSRAQQRRPAPARPRRQTSRPPQHAFSTEPQRLRPQQSGASSNKKAEAPESGARFAVGKLANSKPVRRLGIGAGLMLVAVLLIAFAVRGRTGAAARTNAPRSSAEQMVAAAPKTTSAAEVSSPVGSVDVTEVDDVGDPVTKPRALRDHSPRTEDGITANVPLFGPTPMATLEPAPLEPLPADDETPPPAAKSLPVEDEAFDDEMVQGDQSWGRGRLHLPTIHRIRLDGPGKQLKGSISPTGFTVLIPGRKTMENGDAIARRDKRIASVSASNGGEGARVTFRFRDGVPPYRVRLRKDYVEFSVSAEE